MTDPDVVLVLPPCVTATETQNIARSIEAAIAAAVARDREGLVAGVIRRIHAKDCLMHSIPGEEGHEDMQWCEYEARRLLALDAPEARAGRLDFGMEVPGEPYPEDVGR